MRLCIPRRFRAPLRRATLMLCLGLTVRIAYAEPAQDQDLMSLSIEDLAKTKVFSASRHLEETRDAPSSVTIITSKDIARYGWRTLGDVLNSVRGFYTSYDRDYTYVGVRGIQRPGDYNSRILLMVNGHRLNENIFDSALLGTEFPLDLDLIDHIEIVRGPSSSLFGTNAVFGVVNVITRRPDDGAAVEVSGNEASFLSRSGRVTGSYKQGQLSALLSGSLYRSAGTSDLYFSEFAATNGGVAENLDGNRFEHAFADLQYGGFRLQAMFGSRSKDIPTASFGSNFDEPAQSTDRRGYVETSYHRAVSPATDFDVRAYYDWYGFYGFGHFGDAPDYTGVSRGRADWIGTEATLGTRFGRQRIVAGLDAEYSLRLEQKNYYVGQPSVLNIDRTSWLAAAFGEAELHFIPKITIRAGGRADVYQVYGTAFSPRAAAIYQPNSRSTIKYIFGRAFRAPSDYEEYYKDGVSLLAPSSPLKPEHLNSHEIIFERNLKPWLSVTANGFYNDLTDLIDEEPDPTSGLNHFINVGRDKGRGAEFEVEARRASGLSAQASYTFSYATEGTVHANLENSPSHTFKLHGTIPATHLAFVGLESLYTSYQTTFQSTDVPASLLTNITFSTKPLWGGWEFSASCYDVFNQRWFAPAGPELQQSEIRQDGRTFRVGISYRLRLKEGRGKQ